MESRILVTEEQWPDSGLGDIAELYDFADGVYYRESGTAQGDCRHVMNGRQQPCPPMCRCQAWPRSMFRLTFFRHRWVLKRKHR